MKEVGGGGQGGEARADAEGGGQDQQPPPEGHGARHGSDPDSDSDHNTCKHRTLARTEHTRVKLVRLGGKLTHWKAFNSVS